MKAFVTGATGFVGGHLVNALRARGDSVTALVRRPALAEKQGWGNDVRLVRGDLADEAAHVVPQVARQLPGGVAPGRFVLAVDGRPVAFTMGHGQGVEWL